VAITAGTATIAEASPTMPPDSSNPDAELIAACAEFDVLERRFHAAHCMGGPAQLDSFYLHEERAAALDHITSMRATTGAGFAALASTLRLFAEDLVEKTADDYWDDRLIGMLLRDMTATTAADVSA
jgi:hypothetical protein